MALHGIRRAPPTVAGTLPLAECPGAHYGAAPEEMQRVSTGSPGITMHQGPGAPTAPATALLEVSDLRVHYAGVRALHGVSLAVPEGEIVAVLGNNGAGKNNLLRAISGTLHLHGGAIEDGATRFDGRTLSALAPADIVRAGVVQ